MRYNGIIFDLDGVICNTDEYHYQAWKAVANKLGIYFDKDINNRLRGIGRFESFDIILERYNGVLSEEKKKIYVNEKNNIYKELLNSMSPTNISSEVKNTLDILKEKGIKMAIGSSSKNARYIIKKIGVEKYFDCISDGNSATKLKPDPEVFVIARQLLKEDSKNCIVVEDSIAGLQAARLGGFDSAAIGNATNSNIATYNLSTFSNLLRIIEIDDYKTPQEFWV